jgi:hypothetical protein
MPAHAHIITGDLFNRPACARMCACGDRDVAWRDMTCVRDVAWRAVSCRAWRAVSCVPTYVRVQIPVEFFMCQPSTTHVVARKKLIVSFQARGKRHTLWGVACRAWRGVSCVRTYVRVREP